MRYLKDVVILFTDGVATKSGDVFSPGCHISWAGNIPILDKPMFGWRAGEAKNIRHMNNRLIVDLDFDQDLTNDQLNLIPSFVGRSFKRLHATVLAAEFVSVNLSSYNVDQRIHSLANQTISQAYSYAYGGPSVADTKTAECTCKSLFWGHEEGCPYVSKNV